MNENNVDDIIGAIPVAGAQALKSVSPGTGTNDAEAPSSSGNTPTTPIPSPRRRKKGVAASWFKAIIALLLLSILGVIVSANFLLPYLITTTFSQKLGVRLNRSVTIGMADVDLFSLGLTLRNGIIGPDRAHPDDPVDPLLSFSSVSLSLDRDALFNGALLIDSLVVERPFFHLITESSGSNNGVSLLAKLGGNDTTLSLGISDLASLPQHIRHLTVNDGLLLFDDLGSGRTHRIEKISLDLPAIKDDLPASVADSAPAGVAPHFSAIINGSPVEINGEARRQGTATITTLHLQLDNMMLPQYLSDIELGIGTRLLKGTADCSFDLSFSSAREAGQGFWIEGTIKSSDIVLLDAKGNTISIRGLTATGSLRPGSRLLTLHRLELDGLQYNLARLADNDWHRPLINALTGNQWETNITHLIVTDGTLFFIDSRVPGGYRNTWHDVQLTVENFSSLPNTESTYRAHAVGNGNSRYTSQGRICLSPFALHGMLVIDELDVLDLAPYINHEIGANRLIAGRLLNLSTQFAIQKSGDSSTAPPVRTFSEAVLTAENIHIKGKGQNHATIPRLFIKGAMADLDMRQATAEEISLPSLVAEISGQQEATEISPAPDTQPPTWQVVVKSLVLEQATLDIIGGARPEQIILNKIHGLNLGNISDRPGRVVGLASLSPSGTMQFVGTASLAPFSAALEISLSDFNLAERPWLFDSWLRLKITSGILDGRGVWRLPAGTFHGSATISQFAALRDTIPLFTARRLAARGVAWSVDQKSLAIDSLLLDAPFLDWTLLGRNRSSLRQIFTDPLDLSSGKTTVTVTRTDIDNGTLAVSNKAIQPEFTTSIQQLTGSMDGLANAAGNRAHLHLAGKVNDSVPARLDLTLGLFDPALYADWTGTLDGLNPAFISDQLESTIGAAITGGSLNLTTIFHQENNRIEVEHRTYIANLTTSGAKSSAQLPLTLALITGPDQSMDLILPIQGAIDDPVFSQYHSIQALLRNLLLKTAVSPFSLLSSIIPPAIALDLDHAMFPHGDATLTDVAKSKAETLAAVLNNRPRLSLSIQGVVDLKRDAEAIKKRKKQEQAELAMKRDAKLSRKYSSAYGNEEIISPSAAMETTTSDPQIKVSKSELDLLGRQRARAMYQALLEAGMGEDQVKLADTLLLVPSNAAGRPGTRVDFALTLLQPETD